MGTLSHYTIHPSQSFLDKLDSISDSDEQLDFIKICFNNYGFDYDGAKLSSWGGIKFYYYKDCIKTLSKDYKGLWVVDRLVEYEGPERFYARDGKGYMVEPEFPDFNPERLK